MCTCVAKCTTETVGLGECVCGGVVKHSSVTFLCVCMSGIVPVTGENEFQYIYRYCIVCNTFRVVLVVLYLVTITFRFKTKYWFNL